MAQIMQLFFTGMGFCKPCGVVTDDDNDWRCRECGDDNLRPTVDTFKTMVENGVFTEYPEGIPGVIHTQLLKDAGCAFSEGNWGVVYKP